MSQTYHHELAPGTQLDSFEIASVLGVGGFGITYKAFDNSLHRHVAIKEYMPSGIASRSADKSTVVPNSEANLEGYQYGLGRFLDEARTLARFNHPGIVRVSRFLEANATAYMVMDYEQGVSLADYLDRVGALTEREAHRIFVPILQALAVIHAQLFLHRDIKPANIFLRTSGLPVLLDFGAARQAMQGQTQNITAMLTPGYAPFEQYHSDERQGPSSDLYAVGATLFHCISGRRPAEATKRLVSASEGERDPVREALRKLLQGYDPEVLAVTEWMLEPYAKDRPQTAQEVLDRLVSDAEAVEFALRQATPEPRTPLRSGDTTGGKTTVQLPEGAMRNIAAALERHIGKPATGLVARATRKAGSTDELTAILADFVSDQAGRTALVAEIRAETRAVTNAEASSADATLMPGAPPPRAAGRPASEPAQGFSDELLARTEALLAEATGPIAKVLVRKASRQAASVPQLRERLAAEIEEISERQQFIDRFEEAVADSA